MNAASRVVVIGESLVDMVWRTGSGTVRPVPGGSPANVAIGLQRLGHPATLITTWGQDPPGELVAEYLEGTGLRVHRATSSARTTVALAYVDEATGAATYDFLTSWNPAHIPIAEETALLHTGSLAIVVEPGARQVLEACRRLHNTPGCAVAVDLNVRPAVQPDRAFYRRAVERVVRVADVVKASDEDLSWLWPGRSPQESARALLAHGPQLVVLTRGAAGAMAFTTDAELSTDAPKVDVADTIGAGDAFQSALLAAILNFHPDETKGIRIPTQQEDLARILRRCVIAGALATSRVGAQPPTREELEAVAGR